MDEQDDDDYRDYDGEEEGEDNGGVGENHATVIGVDDQLGSDCC